MRKETEHLVRKLQRGGFVIVKVSEWTSTKGRARLNVTVRFPNGDEAPFCYVLKMGSYVLV